MKQISLEITLARQLRRLQTVSEHELWCKLRNRQLEGEKFRRQQPIGFYIVDFVCIAKKIIIEVDGGQHNKKKSKKYDVARTKFLESQGYKVLRFWNNEILTNMDGVLEIIRKIIIYGK